MWKPNPGWLRRLQARPRIAMALARAAATSTTRLLDATNPLSWEFCGFSQNGEDGILDYLSRRLVAPGRYFVEIGAADGLENNSAYLAIARRFQGLMVEGRERTADKARAVLKPITQGVEVATIFVDRERVAAVRERALTATPDVFSLDIDGVDWHIATALLAGGFRPRIVVVEYNSAFGPDRAVTVPYEPAFDYRKAHETHLYYGASVRAWRTLLEARGYRFVTVDSNGVNAFFLDPTAFEPAFVEALRVGLSFAENFSQRRRFRETWEGQFARIAALPLVDV